MPSIIEAWLRSSERITQSVEQASERTQAGLVGDEARREHERGLLGVQVGELVLELAHEHVRARDVARPARADAVLGERPRGRLDDVRMQAHAEVVVGAPVHDDAAAAVGEPHERRAGRGALQLDEVPVAALLAQRVEAAARATRERPRARDVRRARRPLAATCPSGSTHILGRHEPVGRTVIDRARLDALDRARARALPRAHAALARARRGGAVGADLRRADALDGEVGGRLSAVLRRGARRPHRRRRRARLRRLRARRHGLDARPLARSRRCARSPGASGSSAA